MYKTLMNTAKISFAAILLMGSSLFAMTEAQEKAGIEASNEWLKLIDQGQYDASWNAASVTLQLTLNQDAWHKYLNLVRKSLGSVKQRTLVGESLAPNPDKLPAGEYELLLYQTTFNGSTTAHDELVSMVLGHDGKWRPVIYQVAQHK